MLGSVTFGDEGVRRGKRMVDLAERWWVGFGGGRGRGREVGIFEGDFFL